MKHSKPFPFYWKLQTIFCFLQNSENLVTTRIILATFPTYPNCCLPANAHPPALPSRLKQKLKMMFNCHLWCALLLAYTHFQFHNLPLVPLGLCFHSETATSFWSWSYENWGILQLLLGPQWRRLSPVHSAHKRKQRLVKGKNENESGLKRPVHCFTATCFGWQPSCKAVLGFCFILTGSSLFPFCRRKADSVKSREAGATFQLHCGCQDPILSWGSLWGSMERVELHCRRDYRYCAFRAWNQDTVNLYLVLNQTV